MVVVVSRTAPDEWTPRGTVSLSIEVGHGDDPARAWDGTPPAPGDLVQPLWTSASSAYVAVYLRGPNGEELPVFPRGASQAPRVDPAAGAPLGDSFRLSTAPQGHQLVAYVAGRSGSSLCHPASLLQPHAAWHVLSAVGLGLAVVASAVSSGGDRARP